MAQRRKVFEAANPMQSYNWRGGRMSYGAASPCYRVDPKTGARTIFTRDELPAASQDVPEVDPDPEEHTPVLRDVLVSLGHHRLHRHGAFDRIDHRGKLKEHAVPRGLHEPNAMLCHHVATGPTKW
jgi:hypothetical protein